MKRRHNHFSLLIFIGLCLSRGVLNAALPHTVFAPDVDHHVFRDEVIKFVRAAAQDHLTSRMTKPMDNLDQKWMNHYQKSDWHLHVSVYYHGQVVGQQQAHGVSLVNVLRTATEGALRSIQGQKIPPNFLDQSRFNPDSAPDFMNKHPSTAVPSSVR